MKEVVGATGSIEKKGTESNSTLGNSEMGSAEG